MNVKVVQASRININILSYVYIYENVSFIYIYLCEHSCILQMYILIKLRYSNDDNRGHAIENKMSKTLCLFRFYK